MQLDKLQLTHQGLSFTTYTVDQSDACPKPIVLFLHGFPDTPRSFRFQLEGLSNAGYRVFAPTMRGYEPSSQPLDNNYTVMALVEDVISWLDELEELQVHLVGHDWGATVAYACAAKHPKRFRSLTTIAVPNPARFLRGAVKLPSQFLKFWYMNFFQLRGIAEYVVERNDWSLIKRLWRNWSPDYTLPPKEWNELVGTLGKPGVRKATLNYYRQNVPLLVMMGIIKPESHKLTRIAVPTLAITGENDGCIDSRLYEHTFFKDDFPKGLRIERIAEAGHFVHLEKPSQINTLLLEWFSQTESSKH